MASRRRKGIYFSRRRRRWPWILLILIIAITLISFTAYLSQRPGEETPKKAAILDGLSIDYPNKTFIESTKKILEQAGFTVDIYGPENTTLKLLKELPSRDDGLIVFRVHGGRIRQPIGLFMGGGLFIERCGPESYKKEVEAGNLLQKLYSENIPIQEAFNQARGELGPDPHYKGVPILYLP